MIAFFTKFLGRSWLGRVYKVHKGLFLILGLFFAGTVVCNLLKIQITPFFGWGVYSRAAPEKKAYSYFQITYDHGKVINLRHTWNEPQKNYLFFPLAHYVADKNDPSADPFTIYLKNTWLKKHPRFESWTRGIMITRSNLDDYPGWLQTYLSTVTGQPVTEVTVYKKMVRFDADGNAIEIASDTVMHIP
jgi:hypothetical protein